MSELVVNEDPPMRTGTDLPTETVTTETAQKELSLEEVADLPTETVTSETVQKELSLEEALARISCLEEKLSNQRASAESATLAMLELTNSLNVKEVECHSLARELEQSKTVVKQLMHKIDSGQSASIGNPAAEAAAAAAIENQRLREANESHMAKVLDVTNQLNMKEDKNHGLMREMKQLAEENKNLQQKVEDLMFDNEECNQENTMLKKQLLDFKRGLSEMKQKQQRVVSLPSPHAFVNAGTTANGKADAQSVSPEGQGSPNTEHMASPPTEEVAGSTPPMPKSPASENSTGNVTPTTPR